MEHCKHIVQIKIGEFIKRDLSGVSSEVFSRCPKPTLFKEFYVCKNCRKKIQLSQQRHTLIRKIDIFVGILIESIVFSIFVRSINLYSLILIIIFLSPLFPIALFIISDYFFIRFGKFKPIDCELTPEK